MALFTEAPDIPFKCFSLADEKGQLFFIPAFKEFVGVFKPFSAALFKLFHSFPCISIGLFTGRLERQASGVYGLLQKQPYGLGGFEPYCFEDGFCLFF